MHNASMATLMNPYRACIYDRKLISLCGREGRLRILVISVVMGVACDQKAERAKSTNETESPVSMSGEAPEPTESDERRSHTIKADSPKEITRREAVRIANMHFERSPDAGCFVERRGEYFFVAPPYKYSPNLEEAGVYISVTNGELFTSRPRELEE